MLLNFVVRLCFVVGENALRNSEYLSEQLYPRPLVRPLTAIFTPQPCGLIARSISAPPATPGYKSLAQQISVQPAAEPSPEVFLNITALSYTPWWGRSVLFLSALCRCMP